MPFPRIFRVLFGLGIPCRTGDARSEISEADGSDPPFRGPRSISPWREGRRAPGRGASRTWWRVGATAIGASVMLGDARQLDARSVGELVIRRLAAALHQGHPTTLPARNSPLGRPGLAGSSPRPSGRHPSESLDSMPRNPQSAQPSRPSPPVDLRNQPRDGWFSPRLTTCAPPPSPAS